MDRDLGFACRCGALSGTLHDVAPQNVCHLVCYCRDCRAFARHMGRSDELEPGGGTPLVQVLPARITITRGAEHVACLRLSNKGLHRWYAGCCGTPVANTVGSSRMPLAGMWRPLFGATDRFGPVVTHGFTKMAVPGAGVPRRDKGLLRMLGGLAQRSLAAYMAGTARQSPFFDAAGRPVAVPQVLTAEARAAAYAR
ncbi:DUF6151 family protein [Puniceibacterium sp. IMCC21224]|uniref:DUF6151 family protein n=1 Tax=Puniceibacterium sp. IMCC21224 TaxID=1618204 RepID=UPI00064DA5B8|nr:DUF6151 family protein [Puniceibacterium sp. IMCC21224]KMK66475.1 hypothetical protein IMCC21224_111327 [Puniceibacterium sp. IMCC21224]